MRTHESRPTHSSDALDQRKFKTWVNSEEDKTGSNNTIEYIKAMNSREQRPCEKGKQVVSCISDKKYPQNDDFQFHSNDNSEQKTSVLDKKSTAFFIPTNSNKIESLDSANRSNTFSNVRRSRSQQLQSRGSIWTDNRTPTSEAGKLQMRMIQTARNRNKRMSEIKKNLKEQDEKRILIREQQVRCIPYASMQGCSSAFRKSVPSRFAIHQLKSIN